MTEKIISLKEFNQKKRNLVFKEGSKQIFLMGLDTDEGEKIFALDNRCPHEGYPLSEGSVDGKSCLLTCNWHNWKFDLTNGKCVMGADNVVTYPVKVQEGRIYVDLSEPTPDKLRDAIMEGFKTAFDKEQTGRMSRELARLHFNGLDPLYAIKQSIPWSYQKFEYGMNHSYAALADWLALYKEEKELEEKLICLSEGVKYVSHASLRRPSYPFSDKNISYDAKALKVAIENEDATLAESLVNSGLKAGMTFPDFRQVFAEAALEHYNDFGHSLIYIYKASQLSHIFQDKEVDKALALSLVRSLVYTTREDLIPEFKGYTEALEELDRLSFGRAKEVDMTELKNKRVQGSLDWLTNHFAKYSQESLYNALLELNGENFLYFDLKRQEAIHIPVTQNVGWLSFTHAITFANAVRSLCSEYPKLWRKGLLQMVCFYGRNTAFTDPSINVDEWKVDSPENFFYDVKKTLYDHGQSAPIISAHLIKTMMAVQEEAKQTSLPPKTKTLLLMALNRFLHSPLKQAHIRRNMYQAINLVKKDFQ